MAIRAAACYRAGCTNARRLVIQEIVETARRSARRLAIVVRTIPLHCVGVPLRPQSEKSALAETKVSNGSENMRVVSHALGHTTAAYIQKPSCLQRHAILIRQSSPCHVQEHQLSSPPAHVVRKHYTISQLLLVPHVQTLYLLVVVFARRLGVAAAIAVQLNAMKDLAHLARSRLHCSAAVETTRRR